MAIQPSRPPLDNLPSLLLLAIMLSRPEGPEPVKIVVEPRAFGHENLIDFVMRLPEDKLDPTFGRRWRARLLERRSGFS